MARHCTLLTLTDSEKIKLREITRKSGDWRERERAITILELGAGLTPKEVAAVVGVKEETVRERRRKWVRFGYTSLAPQSHGGAPCRLSEHHRTQLRDWIEREPLSSRDLLLRIEETYGIRIHRNTLRNEMNRMGYVWKNKSYRPRKTWDAKTVQPERAERV
jgi:transposase